MKNSKKGFALLITITLLAFLVLLLVSLASLTRVETQVADNNQKLSGARANALLALNLALGQLQKYAGPDQRATARADLSAGVANPYYTGVWDTTAANPTATSPVVWLVSGNESTPTSKTPATDISGNADAILLVDKAVNSTASLQVRVLKQTISSNSVPGLSGPQTVGHYAYWVGDEGVKARANLVSPWPMTVSGAQRNVEAGYNFASAQRTGVEQMAREAAPPAAAGNAIGVNTYVPNDVNLKAVLNQEQLPLAIPASAATAERNAVSDAYRYRFHDLTTHSVSVLADPRSGGLKKDLTRWLETSGASYSGAPADTASIFGSATTGTYYLDPPTWGLLRSFANATSNGTAIGPQLPSAVSQGISPVLVWIEVGFAPGLDPTQKHPRMNYFPRVLLWNPYDIPLNTGNLEVGWSGPKSPILHLELKAAGTGTASTSPLYYNCQSNTFRAAKDFPSERFLRFRINSATIAAGATTLFTLASGGGAYDSGGDNLLVPADNPNYVYSEDTTVTFTVDPSPLVTDKLNVIYPASTSSGNGVVDTYLRAWQSGQTAITAPSTNTYQFIDRIGAGLSKPADLSTTEADITPWFRVYAAARLAGFNNTVPTRWIANGNIRAAFADHSGIETINACYSASITSGSTPSVDQTTMVNRTYGSGSSSDALVLFQVPRADTPLFSVADLRHANLAPLSTAPAYPVATSLQDFRITRTASQDLSTASYPLYDYAYLLNQALWDRHCFSTVPSGLPAGYATQSAYASLPNGRLQYYLRNGAFPTNTALLDPSTAAANLVLKGGFNVNSTSVQAWRAQLAALNALTFDPVAGAENTTTVLNRAFSRFLRPPAGSTNAWRGFRELTDGQLNALAEAIVAEVRARGPFLSLAQFVNRSLTNDDKGLKGTLQAAIDAVDLGTTVANRINTATPFTQDPVGTMTSPPSAYDLAAMRGLTAAAATPVSSRNAGAPGDLTQADILAALGATLTARSDTFVVRTYGDVMNPATGATTPEGQAWCEAVVQRLPDYVNAASTSSASGDPAETAPASLQNSDNQAFGRRFQVVSFRWLSVNDL